MTDALTIWLTTALLFCVAAAIAIKIDNWLQRRARAKQNAIHLAQWIRR